jgi:Raf kinase inhibitor-like YbhB/YbcL family protein
MKFLPSLGLATAMLAATCFAQQGAPVTPTAPASPMVLTLPGFADGGMIPSRNTCIAGPAVVSPEIRWSNVPAGTQSFVLIFHDLEPHPAKGIIDNSHWVLWNIPGTSTGVAEGVPAGATLPDGTHQMKRARTIPGSVYSYYGPCAPKGPSHHYVFELYALDSKLDLPDDATRADIVKASDGHILAAAGWFGLFHQ